MKKQNNILKVTKNIICLAFVCAFLNACTDEEMYKSTDVKEGIPVEINFGISASGMDKVTTRSLTQEGESQVNDLYILVFNRDGNTLKTRKFYTADEIVSSLANKKAGSLKLETTSGESRIYAIANVVTTELNGENVRQSLDNVKSVNELFGLTASLGECNVERVQASLTMSGTFEGKGVSIELQQLGYCTIPETNSTLDGKIVLSRLDSHIQFKIATAPNAKFSPTSWQVKHVPLKSTLIAQNTNTFIDKTDYSDSKVYTSFETMTEGPSSYRTFDFYMLENIKETIKSSNGNGIASDVSGMSIKEKQAEYAKREKEIKKDGKNTGIYEYVEPYATFVEIKGTLEIDLDADHKRIATATYVIHLGGGINNPSNFTSKRNTKYTYLMQINNVNDIIVEVTEDNEKRPGAEGDVVDSETGVRTLDAHYNCFVMGFSYNNVVDAYGNQALKFVVKTPFGEVTEENIPDTDSSGAQQDYHWIHFISNETNDKNDNSRTTLQTYNKEKAIDLFGLTEDIIRRYKEDRVKDEDKLYYYTVFVDEYYYTKAPKGKESEWGTDPSTYWHHFVNQENRYVMLVYAPKYSTDGESSYAKARYMVSQRSIQTYYSSESKTGLGMEHKNETGYGEWESPQIPFSPANGLANTWLYLSNSVSNINKWETHVSPTQWDQNENTFATKKEAIVLARCLSRNRDENGDGEITLDELKWYVPTSEQLMGMYLGAQSLPSPLFDANNISFVYVDRGNYHYATSDNKRIWSEEGASISDFNANWGAGEIPRNFRCVRNLGIDKKKNDILSGKEDEDYPKKAFDYKESGTKVKVYNKILGNDETISADRVFVMDRLTEQNIRGRIQSGEIGIHNNFENNNKPYKAFQMSRDFVKPIPIYTGGKTVVRKDNNEKIQLQTWDVIIRSYWYQTEITEDISGKPIK